MSIFSTAHDYMMKNEGGLSENPADPGGVTNYGISLRFAKSGYTMEEFHDVWTSGVRAYLMPQITRLLDERIETLNEDRECHTSLIWDRAREIAVEVRSAG